MNELKSCPFCGFTHKLSPRPFQWPNGLWVYQCGRCAANSPPTSIKDELNAIWNRRHQPLEPMYYPSEQMVSMNVILERYTKQSLKYLKLLSFVNEIACDIDNRVSYGLIKRAKELLKEIDECMMFQNQ